MTAHSARADLSIKITRADLLKALAAALGSVEARSTIPVLTHFLMRAGDDGSLVVTGTNLDIQTTARTAGEVSRAGAVTVPAQALHDIVRKLRDDAVISIEGSADRCAVTVKSGRAKFVLSGFPDTDFPDPSEQQQNGGNSFSQPIEVAGSILASMFARSQFAISTEETRYYLNGIYAHCVLVEGEPTLRLVATDGHRLARIDTTRAGGLDPDMRGVIVPRKAVDLIRKLAEGAGDGLVALEFSERLVRASAGPVSIVSKLIDGTFPDYARVIPTDFARECVAPTLALIEAVGRVSTVSMEKVRGIKLTIEESLLSINVRNSEGGEATDQVDVELTGEPIEIGLNAKYLAEILAQTGGDTVRIKLGETAQQPAVIGDKLAESLFVLMPLRI